MNYCLGSVYKRDINNTHVVTFVCICRPNRGFKVVTRQTLIPATFLNPEVKRDDDLILPALQAIGTHENAQTFAEKYI